jgi:transcriptional regulator with XRE-family HTH domain
MTHSELKQARQKLGLNQIQLAEAIGMTQTYISLMETGRAGIERRTKLAIKGLMYESRESGLHNLLTVLQKRADEMLSETEKTPSEISLLRKRSIVEGYQLAICDITDIAGS